MKHQQLSLTGCAIVAALLWTVPVMADTTDARCDIYPAGEDRATAMLACKYSQRQGYITIVRADGVTYELSPVGDNPGNYRDDSGNAVYRQSGLGDQGLIFRFPKESIFVYWSTAGLEPQDADNPTAPFSTADYDATALLRCRLVNSTEFQSCPAGVARMENLQASVTVLNLKGERFTINFMTDYVNAANREVDAKLANDTWTVTINGTEVYEVPLAMIGGD